MLITLNPGNIMIKKYNAQFHYTYINSNLIFYSKVYGHDRYSIDIEEMIYLGVAKNYMYETQFLHKEKIINCHYFFGKDKETLLKDWDVYGS